MEVMKNGQIIETRDLSGKSHYTFGRSPGCDFLLEHPSASRLHAMVQFRGSDDAAFLYDAGSAHGTFLNKKQVPAHAHHPIRYAAARLVFLGCFHLPVNNIFHLPRMQEAIRLFCRPI